MADVKRIEEGYVREENDDKTIKSIDAKAGEGDVIIDCSKEEIAVDQPPLRPKTKRVATLDAFRGLTIVLMILVDDAGVAYSRIDHSPWNGCTLADFVMPFFLFIVGVAIAIALKKVPNMKDAMKKITLRTLKLLFWGLLLQGGYSHAPDDLSYGVDMKHIRWCGILQRIGLVYFVVATIEAVTRKGRQSVVDHGHISIFTAYLWQWIGGFAAFVIYMVTTYALYIPDWSFSFLNDDQILQHSVVCGVRGQLGPACNAVGHVDRQVWGINHLYSQPVWIRSKDCTFSSPNDGPLRGDAPSWCLAPFEPEGLLSSVSAILSGTIGIHYGHVLIHFKRDRANMPMILVVTIFVIVKLRDRFLKNFFHGHSERLKQWVTMGFGLFIIGIILHFTNAIPINKQLYSLSYVCFTAGAAGIIFSGFYILIDVWGFRKPFLFLEWIGMNAMLVFVMAAQGIFAAFINGWYYKAPENSLVHWIQKHVFINVWHSRKLGTLLYVIFAEITFWAVVAGILHKLKIYWKL